MWSVVIVQSWAYVCDVFLIASRKQNRELVVVVTTTSSRESCHAADTSTTINRHAWRQRSLNFVRASNVMKQAYIMELMFGLDRESQYSKGLLQE